MFLRIRPILGIFSILSLAISVYSLWVLTAGTDIRNPFYPVLISTTLFSFNIPILFGCLVFGAFMGFVVSVISILAVLLCDLRTQSGGYSIWIFQFFITMLLGYAYSRAKNRIDQSARLKSEKFSEDINIISNDVLDKKSSIYSLEEKLMRYSILKEVAESLSAVLSIDQISRLCIEKVPKILGKNGRVLLYLVDTEKQEMVLAASNDDVLVREKKGDVFDRWVLKHRKSLIVEDISKDFRFSADDTADPKNLFKSLIAAPLLNGDKVIGALRVDSLYEEMYAQDDLRLLDIIAHLGALSVQNSFLYSRTQELAIKDGLTDLFVRRYFLDRLKEELKRAAGKRGALSILMIDIDHFKKYNDTYGHISGDLVLKYLAKTISSMVREGDVVARYGGEEIVILLCDRSKEEADIEAEKIRKAVKEKPLVLRRHEANITVSVGVSSYPEDVLLEEEIIRLADQRLYKAKAQGRDRVCSH